jgi:hypothetical protein
MEEMCMETQVTTVNPPELQRLRLAGQFGCLFRVILVLFVVIGSILFVTQGIWPIIQWWQSQSWGPAYCKIQSVAIERKNNGNDVSFQPKMRYIYRWQERDYEGNQLDYDSRSYSKKSWLDEKLTPYVPGAEAQCFVNPARPEEASLTRDFPTASLVSSAVGLLFVSIGLAALRFSFLSPETIAGKSINAVSPDRSMNATSSFAAAEKASVDFKDSISDSQQDQVTVSAAVPMESQGENQPQVINPEFSRLGVVLGLAFFGLVWNGIIGFVIYFMSQERGGISIFTSLFLIPFVLVGVGILLLLIRQILVLANPQPIVVYSDNWIYPGSEFEVSWMMKGKVTRVKSLRVFVEGMEVVTYRQGTSTRKESNIFYRDKIVDIDQQDRIAQGFEVARIPNDTMHTFNAPNNKIQWQVRFEGEIPWWPDLSENFPLVILPPRSPQELL